MTGEMMLNMKLVWVCCFFLFVGAMPMGLRSQSLETKAVDTGYGEKDYDTKKIQEERSMQALEKLLQFAESRKYDSFGRMMAYVGRDPNRNMRTMINPVDPHEAITIENSCNFIHKYLTESALHHAKDFRVVKGANTDLFFWNVEFTMLNGKIKTLTFLFIELEHKYLFCQVTKA
jgi:hypothetical protein